MKTRTRTFLAFTVTAALSAIASYPAIARAATSFRSYSPYQCVASTPSGTGSGASALSYGTTGTTLLLVGLVENPVSYDVFCPLINDSDIPLNGSTAPTVHLNGDFTSTIGVQTCNLPNDGASIACGKTSSPKQGKQLLSLDTSEWSGKANTDGYFIFLPSPSGEFVGTVLYSYDDN